MDRDNSLLALINYEKMSINIDDVDPIYEATGDKVHRLVRAGLGLFPMGGTAVEIFNGIITPPIEKRRTEWMRRVTEALIALESEKRININELSDNEEFITTLISASQIALKNHSNEKVLALQHIVENKACGIDLEESLEGILINLLDTFTPLHIKILKIFHEGFVWSNDKKNKPSDDEVPSLLVINIGSYEELLDVDRSLIALCLKDLVKNNLLWNWIIEDVTKVLPNDDFYCTVYQWDGRGTSEMLVKHGVANKKVLQERGMYITSTSNIGKRFMTFISKPVRE